MLKNDYQCTQDKKMMYFLTWRRAFSGIRESFTDSNKERFRHEVIRAQNLRRQLVGWFCSLCWRSGKLRQFLLLVVLTLWALDGVWRLLQAGYQIYFNQPGRTNVTVNYTYQLNASWSRVELTSVVLLAPHHRLFHVNELIATDLRLIW